MNQKSIITEVYLEQKLLECINLSIQQKFDESLNQLAEILESACLYFQDEKHPKLGKFYFIYGNTLLQRLEHNTEILNNPKEKSKSKSDQKFKINENSIIKETSEVEEENNDNDDQNSKEEESNNNEEIANKIECLNIKENQNQEQVDDIQLVWENLELSKYIYMNQEQSNDVQSKLVEIHIRLAEFEAWRDQYENSVQEYRKALYLAKEIEEENFSRRISCIYFQLGNALLYENKNLCEEQALQYYLKSVEILNNILTFKKEQENVQNIVVESAKYKIGNKYIYLIDQKEADLFKDRNTYYYNKKRENKEQKKNHTHCHNNINTENQPKNGQCCTTFFAKIYIPKSEQTHIEKSAIEALDKHKLPYLLPELLDYISKKFFKLKNDGIKDNLKWDKQTQGYLTAECLKGGCQQFFIQKIKEFSIRDQSIETCNSFDLEKNHPKTQLNFLQSQNISQLINQGYTYIKNFINNTDFNINLYKEFNFLEIDGRFEEQVNEKSGRSDRVLWVSLSEISDKDFKNFKEICVRLTSIPYELNEKTQFLAQISELFQVSYFKNNGSYQEKHFDSSFEGNQDNGRKLTVLYFSNLDNDINCKDQGKIRIYPDFLKDDQNKYVEFETEVDSLLILKSRVIPYEILPNNNQKRYIIRFWVTGPADKNKKQF
ncbi:hypothetical protein IMG5_174900 [Ichthyophthirius multifiliis]|uniref:Uncharacterized protein n=1 Tax=Ichthyophthirius multifiliis TaxID=5932 RepID=G0R244_ICHMU|nr:hypothetical protein IMG5_174900 [Ichthyophthirius multifiliis]EGR28451.1 hypothetical protein IMG5_174900 [Ichthyophthirius multifiliis]|eukprot:XP_004029687.1 hypothetical protein IMG5_174900 [Ichthyophthirius multifiliis]